MLERCLAVLCRLRSRLAVPLPPHLVLDLVLELALLGLGVASEDVEQQLDELDPALLARADRVLLEVELRGVVDLLEVLDVGLRDVQLIVRRRLDSLYTLTSLRAAPHRS